MIDGLGQGWPWVFAGIGIGLLNILMLKLTVDRLGFRAGDKSWLSLGLGLVLRLALVTGVLYLALQQGLIGALFALMGFWLVRWPLLFWLNRRPDGQ